MGESSGQAYGHIEPEEAITEELPAPPDPWELTHHQREYMVELLKYPNPAGIHPIEAHWRDLARKLARKAGLI